MVVSALWSNQKVVDAVVDEIDSKITALRREYPWRSSDIREGRTIVLDSVTAEMLGKQEVSAIKELYQRQG